MRILEIMTTKFVGCYRTTRRCFWCGWEQDYIVLDGEELTEPNKTDYCLGEKHHQKISDANDGDSIFGIKWHSRTEFDSISILKGKSNRKLVVDG